MPERNFHVSSGVDLKPLSHNCYDNIIEVYRLNKLAYQKNPKDWTWVSHLTEFNLEVKWTQTQYYPIFINYSTRQKILSVDTRWRGALSLSMEMMLIKDFVMHRRVRWTSIIGRVGLTTTRGTLGGSEHRNSTKKLFLLPTEMTQNVEKANRTCY